MFWRVNCYKEMLKILNIEKKKPHPQEKTGILLLMPPTPQAGKGELFIGI